MWRPLSQPGSLSAVYFHTVLLLVRLSLVVLVRLFNSNKTSASLYLFLFFFFVVSLVTSFTVDLPFCFLLFPLLYDCGQVVEILLGFLGTRDWRASFLKFLPTRKRITCMPSPIAMTDQKTKTSIDEEEREREERQEESKGES